MNNSQVRLATCIMGCLLMSLMIGCGDAKQESKQEVALPDLSGTWNGIYDMKADGVVSKEAEIPIDITQNGGSLSGKANAAAPANEQSSRFEGSIAKGTPETITLKQIKESYVATMTGKLESETKIIGTWVDNDGHSGDFEMLKR